MIRWTYGSASPAGPTLRGAGTSIRRGLGQRNELAYVAERMNSVEINGSFYSLQRAVKL